VFESEHKLRHLPFFEEIASHDEGGSAWRSATAGLVVLRLVDTWLEERPVLAADDDWSVRSVRNSVGEMDEGTPIHAILERVVDALQEQKPDIHVVVTPLMAYSRALEYDAKWFLAADVYHSVLSHLHPIEDSDASIAAHMRLGYCYRNLQLIDEATEAFAAASEIATKVGDMVGVLLARVNEGHIAVVRGNLPQAEAILDETIARDGRLGKPAAFLLVDVEGFKAINNERGRIGGDATLKRVAHAIEDATRGTDCVGRLGGDEFGVVLNECDDPGPAVDRIFRNLQDASGGDGAMAAHVAVGAVTIENPAAGVELKELFRLAEGALASVRGTGGSLCARRTLPGTTDRQAATA